MADRRPGTGATMKVVIRVNGRPAEPESRADVVEVEPGIYSLILDGCSYEAAVTGSEIDIDGSQVLQIEVEDPRKWNPRSEEHTSELQSLRHLVCRLLLEKKK